MRGIAWILAAGLVSGCDRKEAPRDPGASGAAAIVREEAVSPLTAEGGALFWFNSRVISDAGDNMYGRYAYSKMLPLLSPSQQKNKEVWFVALDGDYLGSVKIPTSGPEEERILEDAERIGRSLCYIIALYGKPALSFADVDRQLREGKVTGYLGRTSTPGYDGEKFLRLCTGVALPVAFRIDGARLKKISFEFFGDQELQAIGFDPCRAK
jgi:hypothetical protein